jgi:hypothetical protein
MYPKWNALLAALRTRLSSIHVQGKPTIENSDRRVWHKKPLSVFLLFVFAAWLALWSARIPSPGKAVAALGVAAAVMTLLGEMKGLEKSAWILILFGFLGVELSSINIERTANEEYQKEVRAEQLRHFKEIGDGIRESITDSEQEFNATMDRSNRIFEGVRDNINAVTGGSTFCFVSAATSASEFILTISTIGKSPLHEVFIESADVDAIKKYTAGKPNLTFEEFQSFRIDYPAFPFLSWTSARLLTKIPIGTETKRTLQFRFFSMNGVWSETLKLQLVNGQWATAIKVNDSNPTRSNKPGRLRYEYITDNFPKTKGKVNWND